MRFRERCVRWNSTTAKILGMVEALFAVLLLLPVAIAYAYGEDPMPFLVLIPPLFAVGMFQYLTCEDSKRFRTVNGILLVAMVWILMFAIATVPYILSGLSPIDAVFESVSGVTTTGLTIMGDLSRYSVSLLVWRSMTQWIGGIVVVLIFLYFLPMIGFRGMFQNELSGATSSEYTQRTTEAARSFIIIYMVLSIVNFGLLLLCGLEFLEALSLMFTTISTGGLMFINANLAAYSDVVQWITAVFMLLGGTNFYLHYRSLYLKERKVYSGNSEFRMMIVWFILISALVTLLLVISESGDLTFGSVYEKFKGAVFTTISLGTTTGYYTEDFTLWPSQCMILLMFVALIGASSSSTSGGIKFSRLLILFKYIKNGFNSTIHTNAVYSVKIDGKIVDDSTIQSTILIFMLFGMTLLLGAVIFMIYGYDMVDSFGLSISVVSNGGMGFGNFGPTGNFAGLDSSLKGILILLMWVGRLEVITAVVLLTPGFWKEVWLNSRANRRDRAVRRA